MPTKPARPDDGPPYAIALDAGRGVRRRAALAFAQVCAPYAGSRRTVRSL
ncbi:hypothetical protein ACWD5R_28110 [Streptomyces sp. NPDC002514]